MSREDGAVVVADEVAPTRHGNLCADPHEAEAGLNQDGGGEVGRGDHGNGAGEVGQDVEQNDAGGRQAQDASGLHPFDVAQGDDLSPHHTGHFHPHGQADGEENLFEAFAKSQGQGQHQQQCRDAPHDLQQPTDDGIEGAAEVAGEGAQGNADEQRQQHGHQSDRQGESRSGDDP